MSEFELVTFRTGDDEVYFEALSDMADDGYFDSFSESVRESISSNQEGSDFPSEDFSLYVQARSISDNDAEREQALDDLFFYRAVDEAFEARDFEALDELSELYGSI